MTEYWQQELTLGGVLKSELLAYPRIVDLVCAECGERLGSISEDSQGLVLQRWLPHMMSRQSESGEPYHSFQAGPLPDDDTLVELHCFTRGRHGTVDGRSLREAVERYRARGRRVRVPVEMAEPCGAGDAGPSSA